MTPEQIAAEVRANRDAAILARLAQGPCSVSDLTRHTGDKRDLVSSALQRLFKRGAIAKREVRGNKHAYFLAENAPEVTPRPVAVGTIYSVPVKRVWVSANGIGEAAPFPVTLPSAPWEIRP